MKIKEFATWKRERLSSGEKPR